MYKKAIVTLTWEVKLEHEGVFSEPEDFTEIIIDVVDKAIGHYVRSVGGMSREAEVECE